MSENIFLKPLHSGVSVPDIDEAIKWYETMLGFRLVSRKHIPPLGGIVAFLEHGSFSVELFEIEGAAALPESRKEPNEDIKVHGNKHVAYAVEDLIKLMESLKAKNVDIAKDVFPMEGDLVCFIRDNSGNLIELIQQG